MELSDVPDGYKMTEVGVVPEDWNEVRLEDTTAKIIDFRGRTPKKIGMAWGGGEILSLSANNVRMGWIDAEKDAHYGSTALYERWMTKGDCKPGDIVMTLEAPLGNVAQIPDSRRYILSQRVVLLRAAAEIDSSHLAQYLRSDVFQIVLHDHSTGTTAPGIKRQILEKLLIALPAELSEQRAIAEALTHADGLIESLEQLLAKKRDVKQGAMQQLLTGKTRLPGFEGEWGAKLLGDICDLGMGNTPSRTSSQFWGKGHTWISIRDLHGKCLTTSREEITDAGASISKVIPKGTLLMSFKLSIGRLAFAGVDLYTNEAICSFNNLDADAEYLYYALQRVDFATYGKQAVKGYTLNKASLSIVEVDYPSLPEQTAIATVLSDLDAEITALEAKLAKARLIKQGMMQSLLTGRIRLPH